MPNLAEEPASEALNDGEIPHSAVSNEERSTSGCFLSQSVFALTGVDRSSGPRFHTQGWQEFACWLNHLNTRTGQRAGVRILPARALAPKAPLFPGQQPLRPDHLWQAPHQRHQSFDAALHSWLPDAPH